MTDRATNKIYETKGSDRLRVPMTTAVAFPIGTLVQEEGGFANHYDGTNTLLGIVLGGDNLVSGIPTGDTSLTPDPAVFIDTSGATLVGVPVTGASAVTVIGEFVYCNDSDLDNATLTQPTTDHPIGIVVGWRSATDVDVRLFSMVEHLLGTTAAATLGTDWI